MVTRYLPSGLGDDEPRGGGEWSTDTGVEERSLQTPVPLILVEHIRDQDVHDDSKDTRESGSETSSIWSKSL